MAGVKWALILVLALWVGFAGVATVTAQEGSSAEERIEQVEAQSEQEAQGKNNARAIDASFVFVCAALVFFMQAGFAFLEAGSTQDKETGDTRSTTEILIKNVADFCVAVVFFGFIGYVLAFNDDILAFWDNPILQRPPGSDSFSVDNLNIWRSIDDGNGVMREVPALIYWLFQLVFAGTAATIVSGAMAGRIRYEYYVFYSACIVLFVYPLFVRLTLPGDFGLIYNITNAHRMPFVDFAGSTYVHSLGGWIGLIAITRIRHLEENQGKIHLRDEGRSVPYIILGGFILWLGWFGFNAGSQFIITTPDGVLRVAYIVANTTIAGAAGGMIPLLRGLFMNQPADRNLGELAAMTVNGVLAGLVAITAPCAFVDPSAAVWIGLGGGVCVLGGSWLLKEKCKLYDPVGVVSIHLFAGIWGTLSVGLFHQTTGLFVVGDWGQVLAQLFGIACCFVWSVGIAIALFKFFDILRLKPDPADDTVS